MQHPDAMVVFAGMKVKVVTLEEGEYGFLMIKTAIMGIVECKRSYQKR